ncbi:HAMP domain-containing protein [Candidatus Microgenomates bacterium]|nr:HAMP domain-containing protein [Candidatus Microgenomates bacterium]
MSLHLKIALISLISILLPLSSAVFLIQNPILSLILGITVSLLSILILLRIVKPLDTLLKGSQILSDGNLNYRVDIRSGDEFEKVGTSFNSMADILKKAIERLEQDKGGIQTERNTLSIVLSSVVDGIVALDTSKKVVLVNKAAEGLTGFTLSEIQGKPINQFIHFFSETEEISPKGYCATTFTQPLTLVGKDGKQNKINLLASPVPFDMQANLSCILILHDLSSEQELERMKLDFVSMASHELKTPLTNIIGYLSVFIDENKDKLNKDQFELLDHSLVSAKQLLALIENLLNVNKIERDQLSVIIEPTDIGNILTKSVEDLQNQAKQKNITLTLTSISGLPKVLADPIRIGEVVTNLVSNAINYTNPGGQVAVSSQRMGNELITTVADSGIGIPEEAIPNLFSKFFRVSNNLQKASKGTGLGLYISKSIIQKLNGRIWVESELGKGSKFHFSLPIAPQTNLGSIDSDKFVGQAIQKGALNY